VIAAAQVGIWSLDSLAPDTLKTSFRNAGVPPFIRNSSAVYTRRQDFASIDSELHGVYHSVRIRGSKLNADALFSATAQGAIKVVPRPAPHDAVVEGAVPVEEEQVTTESVVVETEPA
jgi:hypothetical protein